jgi:DNA mismatch endonuclease (patch repair protein)
MSDVLTARQRSLCMSRIRGGNTKPELTLRKALWACGLRYRLKSRLPGTPDIVLPSRKAIVFVDGCFWHACPTHLTLPRTNSQFWRDKLRKNVERDRRVDRELAILGWRVIRVWEHDIRRDVRRTAVRVCKRLDSGEKGREQRKSRAR